MGSLPKPLTITNAQEYKQKAAEMHANNPPKQLSLFDQLILSRRSFLQDRLKGGKTYSKIPIPQAMSSYAYYLQEMLRLDDDQFEKRFGQPVNQAQKFKFIGPTWKNLSESEKLVICWL